MIVSSVQPLTQEPRPLFATTMQAAPSLRARSRAPGLGLSAHGTTSKDIAKTSQVPRGPVSAWITHCEPQGAQSGQDTPRSGRPSPRRPAERDIVLPYLQAEPPALNRVLHRFADNTAQRLSRSARNRLANKARLRWKRGRPSLQSLRAPDACAQAKRDREALQQQADPGHIARSYFAASGFALAPTMPSAWQEPPSIIELPARQSGRSNVRGGMTRQHDLHPFRFEGSRPTGVVLACCDAFCRPLTPQTVGGRDQAAIQTREEVQDRLPYWQQKGWSRKYLPPDSPAVPRIAILWRRIKYTWLPFAASEGRNALSEALETILSRVGSQYQITFA